MPEMVTMEKLQEEILKRKMIEEKYYAELENFHNIEIEVPQAIIETGRQLFWICGFKNIKRYVKRTLQFSVLKHKIKKKPTEFWGPVFDAEYYAKRNPDVREICGNDKNRLFKHFLTKGIFEGRETKESFNIHMYIMNNLDLINVCGYDVAKYYIHFAEFGVNENRKCV